MVTWMAMLTYIIAGFAAIGILFVGRCVQLAVRETRSPGRYPWMHK